MPSQSPDPDQALPFNILNLQARPNSATLVSKTTFDHLQSLLGLLYPL